MFLSRGPLFEYTCFCPGDPYLSTHVSVQGTLEYTYARLQQYSSWLEARMVARFDKALGVDDLGSLAECAKVMEEFGRGKAITQVRVDEARRPHLWKGLEVRAPFRMHGHR